MSRAAAQRPVMAKEVIILGPDHNGAFNAARLLKFRDTHAYDVIVIGDGKRPITIEEVTGAVSGMVDSMTRIDVCAHGDLKADKTHVLDNGSSPEITSNTLFEALAHITDQPLQI